MNTDQIQTPATGQSPPQTRSEDETYLKLLMAEQEHTRTKWTVVTFFMSISFAIYGFSFQLSSKGQLVPPMLLIMQTSALFIYWFAFLLFLRFQTYSKLLEDYMKRMEKPSPNAFQSNAPSTNDSPRTTIKVHTVKGEGFIYHLPSSSRLLGYFGVLYTAAVILLWWLA